MFDGLRITLEKADRDAILAIESRRRPALTRFLQVLTWTGEGRWWAFVVLFLAAGIRFDFLRFPHREFALYATLAPAMSWIAVKGLKVFWKRRRPFQVLEGHPGLTPAPNDDSFPSGHTASAFAFTVAMAPLGLPVAAALSFWAGAVAFSRYYLGVHFPSDILVGALIGIAAGIGLGEIRSARGADKYPSFTELARSNREGRDYSVTVKDRGSKILVLAIHGGIEPETAEIADSIAGDDGNEYVFRALETYPGDFSDLHVTASRFDDPRALGLARKSEVCVSIHGFREKESEKACLGGRNRRLLARIESVLKKAFPEIEVRTKCEKIEGTDRKNVANRCRKGGIQIELSKKFRDRLRDHAEDLRKFSKTVRAAVR